MQHDYDPMKSTLLDALDAIGRATSETAELAEVNTEIEDLKAQRVADIKDPADVVGSNHSNIMSVF